MKIVNIDELTVSYKFAWHAYIIYVFLVESYNIEDLQIVQYRNHTIWKIYK